MVVVVVVVVVVVGEVVGVLGQPLSLVHSLFAIAASSSTAEVVVLSLQEEINSAVRHTDITMTKRLIIESFPSAKLVYINLFLGVLPNNL